MNLANRQARAKRRRHSMALVKKGVPHTCSKWSIHGKWNGQGLTPGEVMSVRKKARRDDCDCDEGRSCERHAAEAEAEHAYLRHVPRHQVINDEQSREEYAQELRDAGRGHLVRP